MKSLLIPCHSQIVQRFSVTAGMLSISFAIGCASPGPPHSPSLNLPEIVKDLTAERVGDEVRLHWTTPEKTTDHIAIKGAITAEICRTPATAPRVAPAAPDCTVVKRLTVQSGSTNAEDTLPQSLTSTPSTLLVYRVQLLNGNGRSAGPSAKAFSAAGAAPPPVEEFRAKPIRGGVLLEWKQQDITAPVQLDRVLVAPDGTVLAPAPAKPTPPPASRPSTRTRSRKSSASAKPKAVSTTPPANPNEIKLETPRQAADAGGTVDANALRGESYRYTAQRVNEVSIEGHQLEVRSQISSPVVVTVSDIFPPGAPTGLEAIPDGGTSADGNIGRSIDLSWTANTESDLAGYSVYRQEVTPTGQLAGSATRLNSTPAAGPAYRDQTALPGHRYAYRVTATDTSGNESPPSVDVQETLREQ